MVSRNTSPPHDWFPGSSVSRQLQLARAGYAGKHAGMPASRPGPIPGLDSVSVVGLYQSPADHQSFRVLETL